MAEVLDQTNTTGATGIGFGDISNGRDYMCQGFIPTLNNITAVSFHIVTKNGNGVNTDYKVWIDNADTDYFPTGSVGVGIGGETEIANATLVTGALTKYTLTSSVNLTIGNRYVMCYAPWDNSVHAWRQSYNDWISSTANPYSNGRRVHLDGSFANPVAPDSGNADIVFETYGDDGAGGGGNNWPIFKAGRFRGARF